MAPDGLLGNRPKYFPFPSRHARQATGMADRAGSNLKIEEDEEALTTLSNEDIFARRHHWVEEDQKKKKMSGLGSVDQLLLDDAAEVRI
jgi:hypothetical protein